MKAKLVKESILKKRQYLKKPETYYDTYGAAVSAVSDYVTAKGYEIDEDDWFNKVTVGGKPKSEKTKSSRGISLSKNGKQIKQCLHIQVYRMEMPAYANDRFELNFYIR